MVGAGLRGLRAARLARRQTPKARPLVIDRLPWPGDDVQSQRSNGFVCELGPFAFAREELDAWCAPLDRAPRPIAARDDARTGAVFDGERRHPVDVYPVPWSFATGCEELIQAYRRELDGCFWLGREVTSIAPTTDDGQRFVVQLGGEVPTSLSTREIVLSTSPVDAAPLLAAFAPELPRLAASAQRERRAFVFLGGSESETPELTGYGAVPGDDVDSPVVEFLYCTRSFPRRALPGRTLVRAELAGPLPEDDDALTAIAEQELRRWTEVRAALPFRKVHRFDVLQPDGTVAELRARLADLTDRVEGLRLAP